MSEDRIGYLPSQERQGIENFVVDLEPLKESHLVLHQVNLVIEGGVGTGRAMPHIVRRLFPHALYVGTDIYEDLAGDRNRQSKSIEESALQGVLKANEYPDLDMEGAIIYGNCFDEELVRDIAQKASRQNVLLISYNALTSLLNRNMNMLERKHESDRYTIEKIVSEKSPYSVQLHMNNRDIWREGEPTDIIERDYRRLEQAAQASGWKTDRMDNGLLLLRSA